MCWILTHVSQLVHRMQDVGTLDSGLNSVVLASNNEMVIFPINEPTFGTPRKSQIQVQPCLLQPLLGCYCCCCSSALLLCLLLPQAAPEALSASKLGLHKALKGAPASADLLGAQRRAWIAAPCAEDRRYLCHHAGAQVAFRAQWWI